MISSVQRWLTQDGPATRCACLAGGVVLKVAPRRPIGLAAQHGLAAELTWPFGDNGRLRTVAAAALVPELPPAARHGLVDGGVVAEEADHLLRVIAARVSSGQTGAVWRRRLLAGLEPQLGRERALVVMLDRYLELAATDQPVHSWPSNP